MTVAKDPTPSPVDRAHPGVGLVQLTDTPAVLGQDVLHAQCVRMIRPADPDPVVALVEQLQQGIAFLITMAGPVGQLQPRFQRSDVIVAQNLPLLHDYLG